MSTEDMSNNFPWYRSYPANVPHEINPDQYQNIAEVLDEVAQKYPQHVGYENLGTSMTFERAVELSKDFAGYLQSLPNLKPGDRVAIMMPNLLQYVVTLYACLRAGYVVVNINPLYTAREVNATLKDSGAKAIVIIENLSLIHISEPTRPY